MNLLQSDVANNIPLSCHVCPRRPDFSDVSHLLTHIQSKGHLSAYYKIKVRASSDQDAQDTVDAYDEWYAEYGLEELMRERMSQKDKKKAAGGTTSRRSINGTNSSRSTPGPRSSRRPARELREQSLLDPQLGLRGPAASSRSATPLSYYDPSNFRRSLGPMQQHWGNGPYLSNSPSTIKQESVSSFEDNDEDDVYEPMPRRTSRRRANNSISAFSQLDDASELGDDLTPDNTRLKGIIWPGMAIFDSATPDMKRRRNQKKDACVLRALQATSEIVEPTECVYDTSGSLQTEREITGLPASEDELIAGESEPERDEQEKKRPRRKARQPLIKKEPNTGRVTRGKITAPLYTRTSRTPYFDGVNDDDDDLTYRTRPKKRTGLSIHRDNTGPEITFNQPASMQYLTSGYNPLRSNGPSNSMQRQQMFENPLIPRSHHRQPSWGQSHIPFRPAATGPQQSYSTFGAMFGQQPTANNASTNHTFATFAQTFGPAQVTMSHSPNPLFQSATATDMWDMFNSITDPVDSVMGDADLGFSIGGDGTTGNPLFLSDAKPVVDDEEGTISATSEH
ncbi:hypothetical protein Slin15195_G112270 [Septoria linicola]|uniref:Uncharacterized protein n=1 Tax=Septoria linicola TaxID=215465 RepID=A0A9Q9B2U0_9PEZI|nr:hypothetical protein Slin15195_G112270 [Septoria linicola]